MNGASIRTPCSASSATSASTPGDDLLGRRVGEQARDRERELAADRAAVGDRDPAAQLRQPLHAGDHARVVDADDHDVVRVVRDRGGERPAPQAEAAHEARADAARRVVALDDGELREVARRVGDDAAARDRRRLVRLGGDELAGDDPHHAHVAAARRAEVERRVAERARSARCRAPRRAPSGAANGTVTPSRAATRPSAMTSAAPKPSRSSSTTMSAR